MDRDNGDTEVRLRLVSGDLPRTSLLRHQASVCSGAFSPRGTLVATGCTDGTVHVWEASMWEPTETVPQASEAAVMLDDNRHVLAPSGVWDVDTHRWTHCANRALSLVVSGDGRRYLTIGDKVVRVREASTMRLLATLKLRLGARPGFEPRWRAGLDFLRGWAGQGVGYVYWTPVANLPRVGGTWWTRSTPCCPESRWPTGCLPQGCSSVGGGRCIERTVHQFPDIAGAAVPASFQSNSGVCGNVWQPRCRCLRPGWRPSPLYRYG